MKIHNDVTDTSRSYALVVSSAAKMPIKCWGKYRRIAVLVVKAGHNPPGCIRVTKDVEKILFAEEKLNVGSSTQCAFERALSDARAIADSFNCR